MINKDLELKKILDNEFENRNSFFELSYEKPDPLLIARRYDDEFIILLCALFSYGKASLIVKFLDTLDFSLLKEKDEIIDREMKNFYYRFQDTRDIKEIFKIFKRLKDIDSLENIFYEEYKKELCVLSGMDNIIKKIHGLTSHSSQGFTFLVSNPLKRDKNGLIKFIGNAPYKRWNMFLRWMVRSDEIDLGLWKKVHKKDLILPLDTHTFKVSLKLGLLHRTTYDLQSAVNITEKLKQFDKNDPIKYDFSLYRIGQEKISV